MNTFCMEIMENTMKTRQDLVDVFLQICRPLKEHYSRFGSMLYLGNTGVNYGEKPSRMEGFARVLWGLGPLLAGDNSTLPKATQTEIEDWLELYRTGLISGTDPKSPEYWGDVVDYDQKMVEMAPIAVALSIAPDKLWEPLTTVQQTNIHTWLKQINDKAVWDNNWRLFRVLVNSMFRLRGLPFSKEKLEDDLQFIENSYIGDGWYFDGNLGQMDYYVPFAIQFYALIYAKLMKEFDPERASRFEARAASFAKDFLCWFATDGSEIPFGRSLTYRFAHSAFFSALAYDRNEALPWGEVKSVVMGNLRTWLSRPIFDAEGILTIGYGYPNLIMSERYNGPGSPYWALKLFLFLALDEKHPFWKAEEKVPKLPFQVLQEKNHMLISRNVDGAHVMAFVAGQHCHNHGNCAAKYEKFVYSNRFGFSVSRGNALEDGAFDNTLAVSPAGENFYRMRYGAEAFAVTEDYTYTKYKISSRVRIESYIVPFMPWHVRIHVIHNEEAVDIADGAFSVSTQPEFTVVPGRGSGWYSEEQVIRTEQSLFAAFPWGTSGIVSQNSGVFELVDAFANTNLFFNSTVIPTFKAQLQPGRHVIITAILGDVSEQADKFRGNPPLVKDFGERVQITYGEVQKEIVYKKNE